MVDTVLIDGARLSLVNVFEILKNIFDVEEYIKYYERNVRNEARARQAS